MDSPLASPHAVICLHLQMVSFDRRQKILWRRAIKIDSGAERAIMAISKRLLEELFYAFFGIHGRYHSRFFTAGIC